MADAPGIATHSRPSVIVVGAGISGLVCAFRLQQAGVDVTVLESLPRAGGSVDSKEVDGFLLELGPNSYTRKPATEVLVEDLGLESDYLATPLREHPRYIFDGRRLVEVPTGPASLLKTPLLSSKAKRRVFREPFLRTRAPEEESVADFIRRHLGPEILDLLVAPFVSGIYAGDAERMSMPAAFPLIHQFARDKGSVVRGAIAYFRRKSRERKAEGAGPRPRRKPSALCSFRRGLRQLPDALAARLGQSLQCGVELVRIEAVAAARPGYRVTTRTGHGGERTWEADGLVVATPACEATKLVRGVLPRAAEALAAIPYTPLAVAHVGMRTDTLTDYPGGFGFLVPRGRGVRALGVLWTGSVFAGRAPDGQALMTVFYGGMTDPSVVQEDDRAFLRLAEADLRKTMGWNGERTLFQVTRYDGALPGYLLGHPGHVRRIEEAADAAPAPVCFIGNYLRGISLPDCIRQAGEHAEHLARQLGTDR